jgi:protoporphyrinogen oxidase
MIAVLGAGMAGCGALTRLRREQIDDVIMFDMKPHIGGHTASYAYESGFTFDEGPHISFTKDERMKALFAANVGGKYETIHAQVNNYWQGHWIKHPAQCNLHGLPQELLVEILKELIDAHYCEPGPIANYEDWLVASYGRRFAETFPMQYGLKYHTTQAANMSTDWLGPRLYRPQIDEVLRGALSPMTADVHYIQDFRYPTRGGFVSYLAPMLRDVPVRLNHRLDGIDPRSRTLRFANGVVVPYDHIISSIPLPELIPLINGAPADVRDAASRLSCSTCVIVNLGIARPDISDWHWTYFYDQDFCFSRLNFPHMLSPHNAPPGCGSIQAELYFSRKYKPLTGTPEDWIEPTIRDLRRCGLLKDEDRILFKNVLLAPYANVIFDLERAASLAVVHGYLDDLGVRWCGRYGEWAYIWTDESFVSGERAAERVLDSLNVRASH